MRSYRWLPDGKKADIAVALLLLGHKRCRINEIEAIAYSTE
jgi:hypothetical protein